MIPERPRYEPGETARLQVRMPFRARDGAGDDRARGVLDAQVVRLEGTEPVIEVPVKGGYAPNVFVSVLAVRGRVGDVQPTAMVDLGKPAFKLGIAEIQVGWRAHELKVDVQPDRTVYHVREKARVEIQVRTAEAAGAAAGERGGARRGRRGLARAAAEQELGPARRR